MITRKGDWIQTFTGRQFWPLDPRPEEVSIEDIAHALAHTCRFGGHSEVFYSVGQHSLIVSELCSPEHRLEGLLHDATEAYCGDMVQPLKRFMPEFQKAEETLYRCIAQKFGLPPIIDEEVKHFDKVALMTEHRDLLKKPPASWGYVHIRPLDAHIYPLDARAAESEFLYRFSRL